MIKNKVILCILDGWGYRKEKDFNAIKLANTPFYDKLNETLPRTFLRTSGTDVGLPEGQMGNSEVGHMNLGAGRIILQDLPRIDLAFQNNDIENSKYLRHFIKEIKKTNGVCHLLGLLSDGGVHAHERHILQLAKILNDNHVKTKIHAFLDGRDTPPREAATSLKAFQKEIESFPQVEIATISGRYFAMDRDKRWDRVAKAYNSLTLGNSTKTNDFVQTIIDHYDQDISDEFIPPHCLESYNGMQDGDALLMANFRSDRVRELLSALLIPDFKEFETPKKINFSSQLGMMSYSQELDAYLPSLFPPKEVTNVLGKVISDAGGKQLRIAETEKYAHVTFFFNGGNETPYPHEDRILVPSPKVATYDLKPEMSANEVTEKLRQALSEKDYDLVILNYANPDMVGHTGDLGAAIKAVETIDKCLETLLSKTDETGHIVLITADHGNCEMMQDPKTKKPHTAHTLQKVPLLFYNLPPEFSDPEEGRLADIAPTILELMGLKMPIEMKGVCLLQKNISTHEIAK